MNVEIDAQSIRSSLPGWNRHRRRHRSFLACVVAPTALILLYLLLVARPQYVSEFRYAIYAEESGAITASGGSTDPVPKGMSHTPVTRSSYLVADYLQSLQVIEDLKKRFNLATLFKNHGYDPVFHFWWDNGSNEALLRYWRNYVIDVNFDLTNGLSNVSVRAFAPQDALRLSEALAELSERLVNEVSARPRRDTVAFAQAGLDRAQKKYEDVLKDFETFRLEQATAGPQHDAQAAAGLTAELQASLAKLNTQAAALQTRLGPTAPAMLALRAQIAATEKEILHSADLLRAPLPGVVAMNPPDGSYAVADLSGTAAPAPVRPATMASALYTYSFLQTRLQFAQDFRDTMERNLEQARFNAEVQHEYVELYVRPTVPQRASVPKPFLWTLLSFLGLSVLWMTGYLLVAAMRDHTA